MFNKSPSNLTKAELATLKGLQETLITPQRIRVENIKKNTAIVPNGQYLLSQEQAILGLYEQDIQAALYGMLEAHGWPPGAKSIDLKTGKVTLGEAAGAQPIPDPAQKYGCKGANPCEHGANLKAEDPIHLS